MMNAQYYAYPEGEDISGKMIAANRFAAAVAIPWATVDVLMISKPQGYLPTLARFVTATGPFVGVASAFTLGTYISTNVRQKDDRINYMVGGLCAGAALGAIKRSVMTGFVSGLFFAIAGSVKKLSKQEGWEFFPDLRTHGYGSLRGVRHNFTLMAERPKNWTTSTDTEPSPKPC